MIYFLIANKIFECHFNKNVDGRFKYKHAHSFERITRPLNHKRIILTMQVILNSSVQDIYCCVIFKSPRCETFKKKERFCTIEINMPFCSEY